ncbi:T9SS type A sorting domain-containing protein [Polluticoccus soli]|uniref:T9SS type A sorting domain-containing protein n=2 Tax=Chitinophagaceae TaxID=563835 RepID=UPI0023E2C590|nr:T9SS type A sorting domain-containing protein [Flavipsychrobacter sp. JY13-12]
MLSVHFTANSQTTADYAVQLEAQIQQSPPQIKLTWKPLTNTLSYKVYRKAKGANSWGTELVSLTTADTSWIDNNVALDTTYEYQVVKQGSTVTATGYINAAVKGPAIHDRGGIFVIIDTTFTNSCKDELVQLFRDLRGDGWKVSAISQPGTVPANIIRTIIQNKYQITPNLRAVLILGHIAVPYSGDINPDGHPDHKGAWAADVYYGDVDGAWTDATVNTIAAVRPENKNVPGDGKWDQSTIPSNLELQVSRIDFANMPAFGKTEVQMMKDYLNRDHVYKMDSLNMVKRALIDDNFPASSYPEAFAANGWRNFNPIVSRDSIKALDFISTLNTTPYQWAYGCGGGSYASAGGIGTTNDFTSNNVNGIFTFLFGSYFGDFDAPNCFLRAPLCSNTPALISAWVGRPNWFLHHMALGENIGYGSWLSQNTDGNVYNPVSFATQMVHQALMGDLSLRTDYIKPNGKPNIASTATTGTTVSWTASPDAGVIGYYVYRSNTEFGAYSRRSGLVAGTSFVDSAGSEGVKYYMVRPAKNQQTPSGNYENLGIGTVDSAYCYYFKFDVSVPEIQTRNVVQLYPNPSDGALSVAIQSAQEDVATIIIYDHCGRQVHTQAQQIAAGPNQLKMSLNNLPPATYIVEVRTAASKNSQKWIKQ